MILIVINQSFDYISIVALIMAKNAHPSNFKDSPQGRYSTQYMRDTNGSLRMWYLGLYALSVFIYIFFSMSQV